MYRRVSVPHPDNPKTRASGKNRHAAEGLVEHARRSWQVQEARAQLSSLIDEALAGRPQRTGGAEPMWQSWSRRPTTTG
jgi:hypothetical protein